MGITEQPTGMTLGQDTKGTSKNVSDPTESKLKANKMDEGNRMNLWRQTHVLLHDYVENHLGAEKPPPNHLAEVSRKAGELMDEAKKEKLFPLSMKLVNPEGTFPKFRKGLTDILSQVLIEGEANWGRVMIVIIFVGFVAIKYVDKKQVSPILGVSLSAVAGEQLIYTGAWIAANGRWERLIQYMEGPPVAPEPF